jgi:MSHA biogenesis protein MshQ
MIPRAILAIFLWCAAAFAHAQASYNWPADLTGSTFNCTLLAAGEYNCPAMNFSKDMYIVVTSPLTVHVNGNFTASKNFIVTQGQPLLLDVNGTVTFAKDMNAYMNIKSTGSMTFAKNTIVHGNLNSGNNITINKDSAVFGNVFAQNVLKVGKNSSISGSCSYSSSNYTCSSVTPPGTVDHFLVEHDGTGLTCAPADVTVWACSAANSGGTCPTSTAGISGTLLVNNGAATIASYPFTIAAGQSYASVLVPYAGTKTIQFSTSKAGTTCWDGDSASCVFTYNDSGFDFNVPHHISATTQTVDIFAVAKAQGSDTCAPAFTGTKPVSFTCGYVDPATSPQGTARPVVLQSGGSSVALACGATQTINIAFDSAGKGQFTLSYADVGKIQLTASYPAASMTGSSSFIAYPKSFSVTYPTPPAPTIIAGDVFKAMVTALNDAGSVTPNYGREAVPENPVLTGKRCLPEPGDDGAFTYKFASFSGGAGIADSTWGEVGTIDVLAKSTSYLGVAIDAQGSSNVAGGSSCTGAFGRFRPHHFTTQLVDPAHAWAYSGEPFPVRVNGFSLQGTPTNNYNVIDGFHQDVTFSAWGVPPDPNTGNPGPGAVAPIPVTKAKLVDPIDAMGAVIDGAVVGNPAYTFDQTKLPVKPTWIYVRAESEGASSKDFDEAKIQIRTGRLRISNAFGSAGSNLSIPVRVEYWSGSSWLLNQDDNYTTLLPTAIALSTTLSGVSAQGTVKITNGVGNFTLKHPSGSGAAAVGTVRMAANLGASATDQSCLSTHPATTGAALAWLHSRYGSCNTNWNQDPTATANFGTASPENKATIHVRESFN